MTEIVKNICKNFIFNAKMTPKKDFEERDL